MWYVDCPFLVLFLHNDFWTNLRYISAQGGSPGPAYRVRGPVFSAYRTFALHYRIRQGSFTGPVAPPDKRFSVTGRAQPVHAPDKCLPGTRSVSVPRLPTVTSGRLNLAHRSGTVAYRTCVTRYSSCNRKSVQVRCTGCRAPDVGACVLVLTSGKPSVPVGGGLPCVSVTRRR